MKIQFAAAMLLWSAGSLNAATIQSTTFLSGPINLSFDGAGQTVLPDHTAVTNQFQAQGVDFQSIFYNPVGANPGTPNNSGNGVGDFFANGPALNPHYIEFVNPSTGLLRTVGAADFSLASQPATATITALLGGPSGTVVESFSPGTSITQTNNIFGFQGITFDTISISITPNPTAPVQDHADLIDNIQFQLVPEPGSFALLGLAGFAGLFFYRRRCK
jgi:hypothetical protein